MSRVETVPGRGGSHCKRTNARASLTMPGTAEAGVAGSQRPGGEWKGMRSERLQESYHAGPFLGMCLG